MKNVEKEISKIEELFSDANRQNCFAKIENESYEALEGFLRDAVAHFEQTSDNTNNALELYYSVVYKFENGNEIEFTSDCDLEEYDYCQNLLEWDLEDVFLVASTLEDEEYNWKLSFKEEYEQVQGYRLLEKLKDFYRGNYDIEIEEDTEDFVDYVAESLSDYYTRESEYSATYFATERTMDSKYNTTFFINRASVVREHLDAILIICQEEGFDFEDFEADDMLYFAFDKVADKIFKAIKED